MEGAYADGVSSAVKLIVKKLVTLAVTRRSVEGAYADGVSSIETLISSIVGLVSSIEV